LWTVAILNNTTKRAGSVAGDVPANAAHDHNVEPWLLHLEMISTLQRRWSFAPQGRDYCRLASSKTGISKNTPSAAHHG
jgi:hypothetical protein